jgi:hypothetical protein
MENRSVRTSSYEIFVEHPTDSNMCILVNGYSGAIDIVNKGVSELLKKNIGGGI